MSEAVRDGGRLKRWSRGRGDEGERVVLGETGMGGRRGRRRQTCAEGRYWMADEGQECWCEIKVSQNALSHLIRHFGDAVGVVVGIGRRGDLVRRMTIKDQ